MAKRKTPFNKLPEIPFGSRPKILLVGNGLTLSFPDATKIDDILINEWAKKHADSLPIRGNPLVHHTFWDQAFPMQVVIATNDHVDSCMVELANKFKAQTVDPKQKEMIQAILRANFEAILTTNYSLEMERSTIPSMTEQKIYSQYLVTKIQSKQQTELGIFQGTKLPYANEPSLWHIHGTALRKKSMVMGQFYYGKLMSEVVQRAHYVSKLYQQTNSKGVGFSPESWIDYFLIGDVHCIGFSLDMAESDIWWLLSFKKSAFPESSFTLYERNRSEGIHKLLYEAYNIKCPDVTDQMGKDYTEFYINIAKML